MAQGGEEMGDVKDVSGLSPLRPRVGDTTKVRVSTYGHAKREAGMGRMREGNGT